MPAQTFRSLIFAMLLAVSPYLAGSDAAPTAPTYTANPPSLESNPNLLLPREQEAGWRLLFNGYNFDGWRNFRQATVVADRWAVEDGCIHLYGNNSGRQIRGDLITTESFSNFEFAFEWLAGPGVNSGVKYLIDEYFAPSKGPVSFEYQLLVEKDPAKPKQQPIHSAGALYDMIPPKGGVLRPAGMFNDSRIVVRGMHVEHWLNGEKVVEFDRASPSFREMVAESKFRKWPGFGLNASGHIGLQDHGGEIWFRRLRIRPLAPAPPEVLNTATHPAAAAGPPNP